MKFYVVKEGQGADALGQLAAARGGLAGLQALNPHLDLQRVAAGSMLIWPAGSEVEDAQSIPGSTFESFAAEVRAGLRAAGSRVRAGIVRQEDERKATAAVFRSAAFKRVMETDAEVRAQAGAADARAKLLQSRAKDTGAALEALERAADEGLAALAQVLRR